MSLNKICFFLRNPRLIIVGFLYRTAKFWPDRIYLEILYYIQMGSKLNLKKPKTFNEKLQWLKLYNRKPEYTTMVDKYAVKEYVAKKIGEKYVIPTLGVWDRIEDINWDALPNQFVLKTTHGGGSCGVVICKDKNTFNRQQACQELQYSLNRDIYLNQREWPYKNVPKRIIAEKYMVDEGGMELKDYKFFCFNGVVECFKVDFDRFISHKANYYDRNANLLPFGEICCMPDHTRVFEPPQNFTTMRALAETLSKDIPFARIDFYNINGNIYFGEITFFPAAGMGKFDPEEWDKKLGNLIKLPLK